MIISTKVTAAIVFTALSTATTTAAYFETHPHAFTHAADAPRLEPAPTQQRVVLLDAVYITATAPPTEQPK